MYEIIRAGLPRAAPRAHPRGVDTRVSERFREEAARLGLGEALALVTFDGPVLASQRAPNRSGSHSGGGYEPTRHGGTMGPLGELDSGDCGECSGWLLSLDRWESLDPLESLGQLELFRRLESLDRPESFDRWESLDPLESLGQLGPFGQSESLDEPESLDPLESAGQLESVGQVKSFDGPESLDRPESLMQLDAPGSLRSSPGATCGCVASTRGVWAAPLGWRTPCRLVLPRPPDNDEPLAHSIPVTSARASRKIISVPTVNALSGPTPRVPAGRAVVPCWTGPAGSRAGRLCTVWTLDLTRLCMVSMECW
jgi:hypothetical protein